MEDIGLAGVSSWDKARLGNKQEPPSADWMWTQRLVDFGGSDVRWQREVLGSRTAMLTQDCEISRLVA
ncbi:MAG: hypothetical protein CMJ75_18025 [Planctomycetaceae bacterium]|nr:hypothetical protein [Planctomycetaceae bacterium]